MPASSSSSATPGPRAPRIPRPQYHLQKDVSSSAAGQRLRKLAAPISSFFPRSSNPSIAASKHGCEVPVIATNVGGSPKWSSMVGWILGGARDVKEAARYASKSCPRRPRPRNGQNRPINARKLLANDVIPAYENYYSASSPNPEFRVLQEFRKFRRSSSH